MKQLKESLLSEPEFVEGYIEYDWFKWPSAREDFLAPAQDCNAGVYAQYIQMKIDEIINEAESEIDKGLKTNIFREVKSGALDGALWSLQNAQKTLNRPKEYYSQSRIIQITKGYKFFDELFSTPTSKKLLSKFDPHLIFINLWRENWWLLTMHIYIDDKETIKKKDRDVILDEWTKVCKKHSIADVKISHHPIEDIIEIQFKPERLGYNIM